MSSWVSSWLDVPYQGMPIPRGVLRRRDTAYLRPWQQPPPNTSTTDMRRNERVRSWRSYLEARSPFLAMDEEERAIVHLVEQVVGGAIPQTPLVTLFGVNGYMLHLVESCIRRQQLEGQRSDRRWDEVQLVERIREMYSTHGHYIYGHTFNQNDPQSIPEGQNVARAQQLFFATPSVPSKRGGVSPQRMRSLRVVNRNKDTTTTMDPCVICMESLTGSSYHLHCGHVYHVNCLRQWMRNNQSCPMCRKDIA